MSFFSDIVDFFESIFMSSNPEVKKKQALKKIEAELRNGKNSIYHDGMVEANFAELLRLMFFASKPLIKILEVTLCSDDITRNRRYEEQLLLTGFSGEAQEILESLSYENRKRGAQEAQSQSRYFDNQRRQLEKVVSQMNSQEFVAIEEVIDVIKQIYDICNFKYVTVLRIFDVNFSSAPDYKPNFQDVPADLLETAAQDLYYVMANLNITNSVAKAILALGEVFMGEPLSERQHREVMDSLKKIQTIRRQVFTDQVLCALVRITKKNPEFVPEKAVYKGKARQTYAKFLQERFIVDENRMKGELQDEMIESEVKQLFTEYALPKVSGYNSEVNAQLKQSSPASFAWILPFQVLKGFMMHYYMPHVKPLLNDIAIEGFFSNPAYKTDFAQIVYNLNESIDRIEAFEKLFDRNGPYDEALLTGFIRDSHKDNSFIVKLKDLVDEINIKAKELIQAECTTVNQLHKIISELLVDSKKATSETIGNLRVLMMSSRNKENSEVMERQHSLWVIFLEIMRNYVIIGSIDKE